jgi:hypothetical protein
MQSRQVQFPSTRLKAASTTPVGLPRVSAACPQWKKPLTP